MNIKLSACLLAIGLLLASKAQAVVSITMTTDGSPIFVGDTFDVTVGVSGADPIDDGDLVTWGFLVNSIVPLSFVEFLGATFAAPFDGLVDSTPPATIFGGNDFLDTTGSDFPLATLSFLATGVGTEEIALEGLEDGKVGLLFFFSEHVIDDTLQITVQDAASVPDGAAIPYLELALALGALVLGRSVFSSYETRGLVG